MQPDPEKDDTCIYLFSLPMKLVSVLFYSNYYSFSPLFNIHISWSNINDFMTFNWILRHLVYHTQTLLSLGQFNCHTNCMLIKNMHITTKLQDLSFGEIAKPKTYCLFVLCSNYI